MEKLSIFLTALTLVACSSAPERVNRDYSSNQGGANSEGDRPSNNPGSGNDEPSKNPGGGGTSTPGSETPSGVDPMPDKVDPPPLVEKKAKKLVLSNPKVVQDGFDYTQAAIEFTAQGKGPFSLSSRYLYEPKVTAMSKDSQAILQKLCQSTDFSDAGDRQKISWRSHYSTEKKNALAAAIAAGHKSIACILEVKDSLGDLYFAQFDPLPIAAANLLGSGNIAKSLSSGVMLLVENSSLELSSDKALKIPEATFAFSSVKSLNVTPPKLEVSREAGTACAVQAGDATKVSNPTIKKDFTVQLNEGVIKEVKPLAVAGKILKSCANVSLTPKDDQAALSFTCGGYHETKQEGSEAGCQWSLVVENKNDAEDSTTVTLQMPKITYATTGNAKDWRSGKELVTKSPRNPVRLQNVSFKGFGTTELAFMEKVLDIVIETAPELFESDFENYIKSVVLTTGGSCASGAAGFARIGGTEVNVCPSIMRPGIDVPYNVVLTAHTLVHEVRHAKGFYHDIDRANYQPCAGTAYSLLMDHNILSTCKTAYCPTLKSAAESSYMSDINYSLRNDNRRFQGQCKTWQNNIGFSDDRVRNGR